MITLQKLTLEFTFISESKNFNVYKRNAKEFKGEELFHPEKIYVRKEVNERIPQKINITIEEAK